MAQTYDYGPTTVHLRFTRGDDFEMVLDVEGDRAADTFAASVANRATGTETAFTATAGTYDSADDTTPVTVAMGYATTANLTPGLHDWDIQWTSGGAVRTLLAGTATVLADVA